MDDPEGIAVDSERNVYVADAGNHRVQRFTDTGIFLGQWTGENLGLGRVLKPFDVAVGPRGDVAILDDRRFIVLASRDGCLLAEWSVTDDAQCSSIAVDPGGRVYVAADVVRVFDARGKSLASWPSAPEESGFRREPWAVAVDGVGQVYVTGLQPSAVSTFTAEGVPLATWDGAGMGGEEFLGFPELAVDAAGNVYVAHYTLVQKWSRDGVLLVSWDTADPQEAGLPFASGVAVDSDGSVYIVEGLNNQVKKFAQRGQPL
jgi:hypothetical protein